MRHFINVFNLQQWSSLYQNNVFVVVFLNHMEQQGKLKWFSPVILIKYILYYKT